MLLAPGRGFRGGNLSVAIGASMEGVERSRDLLGLFDLFLHWS